MITFVFFQLVGELNETAVAGDCRKQILTGFVRKRL